MKKRDQFVQELEKNLENLNHKIDEYEKLFQSLKAEARQKYQGELKKVQDQREKIRYSLSLLKTASESAYGELEKGAKKAVDDLKSALQAAKEKFGL